MGHSAGVAAAAAAAQAGAALVQTIGHQTWDGSTVWTVISVVGSQLFLETRRKTAAAIWIFFLLRLKSIETDNNLKKLKKT